MRIVRIPFAGQSSYPSISYGRPRPSIDTIVEDHVLLTVDAETEEVSGIEHDRYLAYPGNAFPAFLGIGDLIGLTTAEIDTIRKRIGREARTRTVLESFLSPIEPLGKAG